MGWLGPTTVAHANNTPIYVWGMDHFNTGNNWSGAAAYTSEGTAAANQTLN